MPLDRYRDKRDFDRTPEPAGAGSSAVAPGELVFVVQKHAARQLHYDVRLQIGDVLASWAVPKGPSLDTRDRRLAVHVEDHPLEYGSFEGTIPAGEYGGGTVMVWDRGTYEPKEDMVAGLEKGSLKFVLHGKKLQGGFTLVRMKPRENERAENWLLIKERDEHVRPREEYDITAARPESAASGRDMDQIAAGEPAPRDEEQETPEEGPTPVPARRLEGDPADIPMQLARLVDEPPEGDGWIREVKYDGYRVRVLVDEGAARMLTRTGQDWTERFEPVARSAAQLPVSSAVMDGEVVALDADGRPDFSALQHAMSAGGSPDALSYMAFDLLALDGWDLRDLPLVERKRLLRDLVDAAPSPSPLRYAEHVGSAGGAFHEAACALELEGSVSKRADGPYRAGRSADWRKVKCLLRQEFVVGGYTEPGGSRGGFGALLLGVYDGGTLRYAGRVGTGFTHAELDRIARRLHALAAEEPPFADPPRLPGKQARWVRPELVAEVRFQEWTPEGLLRHPSFLGLRDDKPPHEVVRESAEETGAQAAGAASATADASPGDTRVAGVRISNPGKLLFGRDGGERVTKLDLARYYEAIAEHALVHLRDRPLTLVRCPHGSEGDCFYQKHPETKGLPSAIRTLDIVERSGDTGAYMYVVDAAGLVSLAQLGVLEVHTWNSCVGDVGRPDRIVFDLDPGPSVSWSQVAEAARLLRDALAALGLTGFLKATGGKGVHVVTPIVANREYDDVRGFAHAFVDRIAQADPGAFTTKMSKAARPGRVFLDYLRNAHGATAIAPYSTRSRPGAPVSVPLRWEELGDTAPLFGMSQVLERVAEQAADPWSGYDDARAELTPEVFSAVGTVLQERMDGQ